MRIFLFSNILLLITSISFAEIPHRKLPPMLCQDEIITNSVGDLAPNQISTRTNDPVNIDLMIAYTPDALVRVGNSSDEMMKLIKRIVSYANQAHANSDTGIHFSLVNVLALSQSAIDNFSTDLSATPFEDGVWDELLPARETYKADMVSVLVGGTQGGTICGLGFTNGLSGSLASSSPYMYSVVSIAPSCSFATLAHEMGHNLGSVHDRANASSRGFQTFSYGYSFAGNSGNYFHTIMAVTRDIEIPIFSSPLLTYDGKVAGVDGSEDNRQSLMLAASTVANYYASLNGADLSLPAPSEPDKITTKTKRSRTKVTFTYKLLEGSNKVPYAPIHVYYSRGKRGKLFLRAYGKSKINGEFSFKESSSIPSGYFYRACYLGNSVQRLCSKPIELAKII